MYAPTNPLSKWHAVVSLTCRRAIYSGIATLIITGPVDSPSQSRRDEEVKVSLPERPTCENTCSGTWAWDTTRVQVQ